MLPNGFTLANLFFGIFAIVAASRGQHTQAGWFIVIGGFCDALDGRIARATNTGSPFGEELGAVLGWVTSEDTVKLPGEPELETRQQRIIDGIPIDAATLDQLDAAARQVGLEKGFGVA